MTWQCYLGFNQWLSILSNLGLYPKDTVVEIQNYVCLSFFCMVLFSNSEDLIENWLSGILINYLKKKMGKTSIYCFGVNSRIHYPILQANTQQLLRYMLVSYEYLTPLRPFLFNKQNGNSYLLGIGGWWVGSRISL